MNNLILEKESMKNLKKMSKLIYALSIVISILNFEIALPSEFSLGMKAKLNFNLGFEVVSKFASRSGK